MPKLCSVVCVVCTRKHILVACSLSVHTPSGLSLDTNLAGSSISHAWLPQAEQGNECKMPSWLKSRIITRVVRWAPTVAPWHLTAHSSVLSLVYLSPLLLTTRLHLCCFPRKHGNKPADVLWIWGICDTTCFTVTSLLSVFNHLCWNSWHWTNTFHTVN